jgi:endonuclease YncB( thermonuclease family)
VGDGDTLRVVDGPQRLTILLACIDAPETAHAPYGAASREYLQELAPVAPVVTISPQKKDRYGRTVAEVFRNGQSVNLAMVQNVQAFAYRKYLSACDRGTYLATEAQAKQSRSWVWAVSGGIDRPWDWRKGPRRATSSRSNILPASRGPAGQRYTCQKIGSYAKAQQLLRQGQTCLDLNGNGVPCESLRRAWVIVGTLPDALLLAHVHPLPLN